MFSLLYTFCLPFYLINIHVFDYPDSRLSGLFTEVPTSPDNRGSTVPRGFGLPVVFPNNEVFDIILRSRNSRNYVGGNHESRTKEKENPASQPIENSRITAGFFRYSRITRSISAESRITQNPFQTLLLQSTCEKENNILNSFKIPSD